jgi:hypothetical protein
MVLLVWEGVNLHNLAAVCSKPQFGMLKQPVHHITATNETVIDQLCLTIGTDHKQGGRTAGRKTDGHLDDNLAAIILH